MLRSPKSRSRRSSLSMNFILSNFFSFWDYFNQKRIKNVIPYDTVAPDARPIRTRTSLRYTSILSLGASSVVPFLRRFSLLSSRSLDGLCFFFLYLSRRRNFFYSRTIPEPRARAMMPRAARPSSNTKYSRRRPRRRDALFRRLALTTKAFFKTEDKRARLEK